MLYHILPQYNNYSEFFHYLIITLWRFADLLFLIFRTEEGNHVILIQLLVMSSGLGGSQILIIICIT